MSVLIQVSYVVPNIKFRFVFKISKQTMKGNSDNFTWIFPSGKVGVFPDMALAAIILFCVIVFMIILRIFAKKSMSTIDASDSECKPTTTHGEGDAEIHTGIVNRSKPDLDSVEVVVPPQ